MVKNSFMSLHIWWRHGKNKNKPAQDAEGRHKNAVKLSQTWQTQRGLRSLILESAIDGAPAFKDAGVLFECGSDFAETSCDKELSGISLMGSDSQPDAPRLSGVAATFFFTTLFAPRRVWSVRK